jgi:hypothetical protein
MSTCRRICSHVGLVFLGLVLLVAPSALLAQCGVERWSVKTGTDPDAGLVNLSSASTTTIATLRGLTAPSPIPSNNRVSPTETTQWVINATLTKFKLESDSDYHLVLSDTAGNTMIVEIPSPSCVGAGSPFFAGIQNARSEFNAKFNATTSFQTVSVPVQIKGVGMFDFLHGQTGVAPNGIELHPVLDIIFNPSGGGGTTTQILGNPGFENGSANTAPWTLSAGVINNSTSEPPHAGSWDAWLDGYGTSHTDTALQQVTIPAAATAATLTFWLHVDTSETTTTTAFDTLTVQVRNSSGTVLSTLATYSNLNAAAGYKQKTFNLTSFKGQTIQIFFKGVEDSTLQTSFVLDDVNLNVTQ